MSGEASAAVPVLTLLETRKAIDLTDSRTSTVAGNKKQLIMLQL